LALLAGAVVVASCGEKNAAQNIAGPTAGSAVKFFNFGVGAPPVNFYVDTQQVTAVSFASCSSNANGKTTDSTCLSTGMQPTTGTTGTGYGANASTAGLYYSIAPGSHTLSGRITTVTDNGTAISNTPATLDNGKFYSYYLSGIYNASAKTVEGFVVEDPLPTIDLTTTYVRFVNASSNSQPMTLHLKNASGADSTIGAAVAYKSASNFVKIDPGNYDLSAYVSGSSTAAIARTGVAFNIGRVYTVTAYGDMTVSTGTNKPTLDNTVNR
jgi:hypothetical protein